MYELSRCRLFYHKSGRREKGLFGEGTLEQEQRALRGLVSRHLHHAEVFLRDEMPFHAQAKLVASRRGEGQ
jgi:hypothetical protein